MAYDTIAADAHPDDERVARIRLDRPDRNDVLDSGVLADLTGAVVDADRGPDG